MKKKITLQLEIDSSLKDESKENFLIESIVSYFERKNNKTSLLSSDFNWQLSNTKPKVIKIK